MKGGQGLDVLYDGVDAVELVATVMSSNVILIKYYCLDAINNAHLRLEILYSLKVEYIFN